MADMLSIYVAQLNPTVGAIVENCEKIAAAYSEAVAGGYDLVVTPELSVVGYPTEDLVLRPFFERTVKNAVTRLAEITAGEGDPGLIIGFPWEDGGKLYNAVGLLAEGEVKAIRYKCELPNYGVFDEKRLFAPGVLPVPVLFRGLSLGLMICEDMWHSRVAQTLKDEGAELLVVPNASPFELGKKDLRRKHAIARSNETGLPLLYCNQVGGQDELVFDGTSFAVNPQKQEDSTVCGMFASWQEISRGLTLNKKNGVWRFNIAESAPALSFEDDLYHAVMLGLRDYVGKNGFPGVIIGLSGGIDSALSAAIAVDALGPKNVHCVMMPSRFTSKESLDDARNCAEMLGVSYDEIPIEQAVDAFDCMLAPMFKGHGKDTTEENIQSRIRGVTLMALSNKFGSMVLTTGNKSEVSVGYATLYGDMCGGFNALKDLYKLDVFALSRWRNENKPSGGFGREGSVMPGRIIEKPPTAELRADQKDEDSLPPYERLDPILRGLVDADKSVNDLIGEGYDAEEVARIEQLLYIAEYKRRQASPGVKVTIKHFGRDRRYPITNGFRSARHAK